MAVSAPCSHLCRGVLPFPATAKGFSPRSRGTRPGLAAVCRSGPAVAAVDRRRCECFDLHQQIVPFVESWDRQRSIVTRRKGLVDRNEDLGHLDPIVPFVESWDRQRSIVTRRKGPVDRNKDHSDSLIMLQHPPVYILGTSSKEEYLHFSVEDAPCEIHRIDRDGEVTYHGPGQLVMYPILNLRYHEMDTRRYIKSLESVIIGALQSEFSIKASRIEGLAGVWVGDQKVAAIGIMISRWIAYHVLVLNVTTDLTPFERILPCGIKDCGVGSIKEILQKASYGRELNDAELMDTAYKSLTQEFDEVFQLSLNLRPDLYLQEGDNINQPQNVLLDY